MRNISNKDYDDLLRFLKWVIDYLPTSDWRIAEKRRKASVLLKKFTDDG